MEIWIGFTLLAAFMQAVRTAGQKTLSTSISAMATTMVRYAYGLPFAAIYLAYLLWARPEWQSQVQLSEIFLNGKFIAFASAASIAQIGATFALIKVFAQRNFAVGTSFAKTEAIQVAILGAVFFGDHLNTLGWLAVIVGVIGTLIVSGLKTLKGASPAATLYGIASGALFALTSLCLREASLSLGLPLVLSAAITLIFMVCQQSIFCAVYLSLVEPEQWRKMRSLQRACWFVGATSAAGSVGWFTAMSLQNAALVKTLGQVEFFITLALTRFYFKEKIARFEFWGMACIVGSVILVLQT